MKSTRTITTALLMVPLFLSACTSAEPAASDDGGREQVTLTLASSFNRSHSNNDGLWLFVENLEANAPWITVDYKGGPEVMAPNLLIEGVSAGVFDMGSMPGDYYVDQMPAMNIPRYTPYSPMEERERGITDIYDEMHRDQLGITYLGHSVAGMAQVILVDTPLTEANLRGKSIRTSSATSGIVDALGGVPVDLPGGEVYTALERGVVDGASWAAVGPSSLGLQEVVGHHLAPRFYESVANLVMNERTWENLDAETQQAITDTITATEPQIFEHFLKKSVAETREWEEAGVGETLLPEEEAAKIFELAYRDEWELLPWEDILATTPDAEKLKAAYEEGLQGDLSEAVPGGSTIDRTLALIEELEQEDNS
ncbi:Monocarboxylate 2-oxoacid-binding periplasmic protein precursor [Corynebacterium occultum]|uniref:Monocarboxylate 2-oxoacid-binding periplasmic protein n=1 Tax=Corynebacterium occultum TaxID=2675219 RepID=A0A6B8VTE7_9CORY|nr:TRAP transporter substrate-binding protein DctP [Corynebacterium occultum]QGU07423.1 Monocarboxylate 2-oxoacid-binding periplasmic protein precursor [Corynebacterium occultum]